MVCFFRTGRYEFEELYVKIKSKRRPSVVARANEVLMGLMLSPRTVECIERILSVCRGKGAELSDPRFPRKAKKATKSVSRVGDASSDRVRMSTRLFGPGTEVSAADGPLVRRKRGSESGILQDKFELFQAAVSRNPLIRKSIRRSRFDLVCVLEQGVPKPVPRKEQKQQMVWPRHESATRNSIVHSGKVHPERSSIIIRKASILLEDEALAAALLIQKAFRRNLARGIAAERRANLRGRHLFGEEDTLVGAVEVSWVDITKRFVEYVAEHFWESSHQGTCTLILETWTAHLLKARTRALDENGDRVNDLNAASSIELVSPEDLPESELSIYKDKQNKLSSIGVTVLVAKIVFNLADTVGTQDLPSVAIELMVELLNGGNEVSQATLYEYLVEADNDCRFLEHLEKRLSKALSCLWDWKRSNGADVELQESERPSPNHDEEYEDCILTARLIHLLCEGHHQGFQNYVRTQEFGESLINYNDNASSK